MKYTLIIALFLFATSGFGQSYLITTKNDSIVGKFSIMEDSRDNEYVRIDTEDGRQTFRLLEVKKLVDKKGKVYVPLLIEGKYRFGQEVITGYLSKYLYTPLNSSHKFQEEVLIKMDGSTLVVPGAFGFRGLVSEFLSECERVSNAVQRKEYKQYQTSKLVNDFNACMLEGDYVRRSSAEQVAEKLETSTLEDETAAMIADFKTKLNNSTEVRDKEEALEMFDDIVAKLSKGDEIPKYLTNAFRRTIVGDEELMNLYKELITRKN